MLKTPRENSFAFGWMNWSAKVPEGGYIFCRITQNVSQKKAFLMWKENSLLVHFSS